MRNGYYDMKALFGAMVCDTEVPYYDAGVSCGLPNEVGDIPAEMMLVPGAMTMGLDVFMTKAVGDSMEGVGIHDGDLLLMETTRRINSGDIVRIFVDGQVLLKTYQIDAEGRHWLVPSNDDYDAMLLKEEMDIMISGRLLWHVRKPHETTRNIQRAINRQLQQMRLTATTPHVLTRGEVEEALRRVGPAVKVARHWLGACRVLMDRKFMEEGRFDLFCQLVKHMLPAHLHLPKADELQRMAVLGFSKPFKEWSDATAPVHGKNFLGYYDTGAAMLRALPE